MTYSNNTMAVILLCSQLGMTPHDVKPFTISEWNKLVSQLTYSAVKEPANLMPMSVDEIQRELSITPSQANRIFELLGRGGNMTFLLNQLAQKAIYIITRSDTGYPARLRKVLGKNAPPLLYFCGDLALANREGLAIVGSRNIDLDGERFARELAKKTSESGYAVYSGGARGVDEIAEQSALTNGGCCISFLADSMERKIRTPEICNAVSSNKMLLLSAVNPSAGFQIGSAMARNQYVYALSLCAVVVASEYNRGGTWAGATHSIKNHTALTYVWNTPKYPGNHPLIRAGGLPIEDDFEKLSIAELLAVKESISQEKYKQQHLSDILDGQSLDAGLKIEKDLSKVEQQTPSTPEQDVVYKTILPLLLDYVKEPTTVDEIAKQLNVLKKQADIWVKYAVETKQMKKLTRPIRYVRSG